MKISIVGTGHVGLTTAACLAHIGHEVLGVDEDPAKRASVEAAEVPFYEPGLADLVREGVATGRLRMTGDTAEAARHGEVVFVCVGTPTLEDGEADLSQVERVARDIAASLNGYTLVTEKSTVPVGTGDSIRATIEESAPSGAGFEVASNPEFLMEGRAVQDTLEPSRIVVGVPSERAADTLREVYRPIIDRTGCPFIVMDVATAELVKHSSNAFLATKISFINQVADVCERTGADVEVVARAMGMDGRIGRDFLRAGVGYGGSCFRKDVQAYRHRAEQLGVSFPLLAAVDEINQERRDGFVDKIVATVGDISGKRIALWGLAFKPETDDLRDAPALDIARRLVDLGATVVAHDPVAIEAARTELPQIEFADDPYAAADGADLLTVCTEWDEYKAADLGRLHDLLASPVVVDGRNIFDPAAAAKAGFLYVSIGRPIADGWNPAAS